MDEIETIKKVIETGETTIGTRSTEKQLKNGKVKLIILSNNCPKQTKEDIEQHANITGTPIHTFNGTSMKLGEVCRKPFPIAAMAIINQGQANITQLRSNK
ncbi:50S ribosomal protein L30e [archaeon]|nr:50S ribosomal protein L30e [archaeon]